MFISLLSSLKDYLKNYFVSEVFMFNLSILTKDRSK